MKRWIINKPDEKTVSEIIKKTDLSQICAEVMVSRGFTTVEELDEFFNKTNLSDPFELVDMQRAVDTILNAVDENKLICIYGDYDCDGVTSTVVLYHYLDCMGANVMYYIPEREEGYGMNMKAVKHLADVGVELIVTVDNGISAREEAEYIYELGMKLVVTDHHQPPEILPRAEAVVDPHRKDCPSTFKNLAGVGVVLKLCAGLDGGDYTMVLEQYADLVAIGTVADVVRLDGENRKIVSTGLELIKNSENEGLNYLIEKSGVKRESLNSTSIAFALAPRINASGRFGSPITAVKGLLEEDEDSEVQIDRMIELNNQRKQCENEIIDSINNYISQNPEVLNKRVLVLNGKGWHHGVIGIVSARIMELYGKPNFIISVEDNGNARGSARSIEGFSIHKCLSYCESVLEKFGGHQCAGGFSLKEENIPQFERLVQEYASKTTPMMPVLSITADKVLRGRDLTINSIESLNLLEPFGEGNKKPVFAVLGARLSRIVSLSQGRHTKLELEYDGAKFPVLMFSVAPEDIIAKVGECIDLLVTPEVSEYMGKKQLSVRAIDYRLSKTLQEPYFSAKACYESLMLGEILPQNFINKIVPTRDDLVELYKIIMSFGEITYDHLFMRVQSKFNYCKLRLCIDIFSQSELAECDNVLQKVKVCKVNQRKDVTKAPLYIKLQSMIGN